MTSSEQATPAVELRGITKRFGQVVACDRVDLELHQGCIHGILGENGAGKSTLMKMLIGLVIPDHGDIIIDGERVTIASPSEAAAHGIGMVHQHFSVVEALTVWENVALGDVGRLDRAAVRDRVGDLSRHYGLPVDPDAVVGDLPAGMRQRVEIIKCLRRDPMTVIFDEPTSVLTPGESEQLFEALRQVVDTEGRAVALVSHKLDEILRATDLVTIMRHGRVVEGRATAGSDAAGLALAMVGRPVSLRSEDALPKDALRGTEAGIGDESSEHAQTAPITGDLTSAPALELDAVTVVGDGGQRLLDGIDLVVRAGEIVGLAGVEGNGQRALGDLLSSLVPLTSGDVRVRGASVRADSAGAMARAGVAVVPEDRHDSGCVLEMTVAENLFLCDPSRVARRGIIDRNRLLEGARRLIDQYSIRCDGPDAPMWSLSGGNQQRVVLARELAHDPVVLVAAQPTRGLDVGAIEYMSDQLRHAAGGGVAVLLISTELDEILDLADRIVVINRGRIVGEMDRDAVELARLGLLMGGSEPPDPMPTP